MAQSIIMNWTFSKGEPVIESTLDTHSETGDFVPRYRVRVYTQWSDAPTICANVSDSGSVLVHKRTQWRHYGLQDS